MFGSRKVVSAVVFTDPAADKYIPILRAPVDAHITIESAYICPDTTVSASTTNYYELTLMNGGAAGTAQDAISDVVGNQAVAWTANTPKAMTIVDGSGKLTDAQWLVAKYNEEGTVGPGRITVVVEYVLGLGEKAAA